MDFRFNLHPAVMIQYLSYAELAELSQAITTEQIRRNTLAELSKSEIIAVNECRKYDAVRQYRTRMNVPLIDAKNVIEQYLVTHGRDPYTCLLKS